MTAATDEAARQVTVYQRTVAAVRAAVLAHLTRVWNGLDQYRDDDIDRWVAAITPTVTAGLAQVAALTDAHLATMIGTLAGTPPKPLGVRTADVTVEALRGVPAAEVYRRAGVTVWTELAGGVDLAMAAARGLNRATKMAATDLQLAKTHTAKRAVEADKRVVGYRRTLTGSRSCKLCVIASTQRYHRDRLMEIHGSCDCGIAPIVGAEDPGKVINSALLAEAKKSGASAELSLEQAASRSRKSIKLADERADEVRRHLASETDPARKVDLEDQLDRWNDRKRKAEMDLARRSRTLEEFRGEHGTIRTISTRQHGEIGPVLTDAEHAFTTL